MQIQYLNRYFYYQKKILTKSCGQFVFTLWTRIKKTLENLIVEKQDRLYTGLIIGNSQEITVLQTVFNNLNNTYYYDGYYIIYIYE